jgi:hypothetical protein
MRYISRRTEPLLHFTDLPKLRTLDIHVQESDDKYTRCRHETDHKINYMERSKTAT